MAAPSDPGPGFGLPPAHTGNRLLDRLNGLLTMLLHAERRVDPFYRPLVDRLLLERLSTLATALINRRRSDDGMALAEEREQPDEAAHVEQIIAAFTRQMEALWTDGHFERGGNTKTHGVVRAEFIVEDGLPEQLRHGLFAHPRTYPAWVRFAGPGPYVTTDIDDVGFMSMSIKIMDVDGPKLLDDERCTQDMLCVSTPTFVTPDIRANVQLQQWSYQNASIFYFFNFHRSHVLDSIMQFLWTKTQTSPLESEYFSCVPYLLGEGQAMKYSFHSRRTARTRVPRLPLRPPDNYLRDAMVSTLAAEDVEFDIRLQVQTDPFRMPIENAAVLWPTKLSPRINAAVLRIPRQSFDSTGQMDFARALTYNPWHCVAEHRPLGNQSRARRRMYWELSRLRQSKNHVEHYEPTGDETFGEPPGAASPDR